MVLDMVPRRTLCWWVASVLALCARGAGALCDGEEVTPRRCLKAVQAPVYWMARPCA